MHLVVLPLPVELATVAPSLNAPAFDIVVNEIASVGRSVSPVKFTNAVLLSVLVHSLVAGVVRPDFLAAPVLLIFEPLAFILGAICVVENTVAVSLIVLPFATVNSTVSVNQAASSVCLVVLPVSLVKTAVNPDLHSLSIFSALHVPFTFVLGAIVENNHLLSFSLH